MQNHFELNDTEFAQQFERCTLDPTLFSHEAHLRLAWIHLRNYGIEDAINHIRAQLLNFVDAVGDRDKYNETVTVAAIRAVYHFMLKSSSENFSDFIAEFPRLKNSFKELLGFHYHTDIFNSDVARHMYLEPELLPFD